MKKRIAVIAILLTLASSHVVLADSGTVNASSLRVRQKPSVSSSIISSLPRNTKINTLGKTGVFYKISYKGRIGYVHSSYIKIVKAKVVVPKKVLAKPIIKPMNFVVSKTDSLVVYANKFLKMPYKYGGTTPARFNAAKRYIGGGFDCSGFVQYIYRGFNVSLPRVTYDQAKKGTPVKINNLKKGDLVFFIGKAHVGIYVGNNKFIHSHKTGCFVEITELSGFWRSSFVTGRRILK